MRLKERERDDIERNDIERDEIERDERERGGVSRVCESDKRE